MNIDRKTYVKDVYSRYWISAREKKYGFMEYDKNLCKYISDLIPPNKQILEVAIGTGYPVADFFQKKGYLVHGIDLSPALIQKCKTINSDIECKVGDAENIEYPDNYFDLSYCFHSTWLFPDLKKALDEMLRVTKQGGGGLFLIL